MAYSANQRVKEYKKSHRNRIAWRRVVAVLGCAVVFCTTYALILPAITQEHTAYCGIEEHTHSEEAGCYEKVLICGFDDTGAAAEPGHVHTDACYEEQRVLACALEESSGHVHDEACYDAEGTLVCGEEEGAGAHVHDGSCYETERVLICGQTEETAAPSGEPHVHTEECYENVLVCQLTEHTHSTACFSDPSADLETAKDWERDFDSVELTGYYAEDLLAIAETQIGYKESENNYLVTTNDAGEELLKGYTRYGAWYGMPYEDWCAMFVSFCLNYAKVSTDDFPMEASCQGFVEALSSEKYDLYVPADEGYIPAVGDLIFFDDTDGAESGDGLADRVGIVSKLIYDEETQKAVDEAAKDAENPEALAAVLASAIPEKLETIEGDSDNRVQKLTYALSSADIMGYGCLPLGSWKSLTSEGADYTITVNYSALAELPEDVRLEVTEILPGTEEYATYAARAAEAMGEEEGEVNRRFFDITLMSGDTAVEPAVPVKVDVSFPDRPAAEEETVLHFPEDSGEVEVLTATVDKNGLHYEQSGFSVVGFTTSPINTSYTYAIVNNGYALTLNNESGNDPSLGVAKIDSTSAIPDSLLRWQFSASGSGYTIRTTASNGNTYYLRIDRGRLELASRSQNATVFTWSAAAGTLSYRSGGTTYYISIAASGATASTTSNTVSLYYDPDAGKVATISPSSTVINLFDYRANVNSSNWKEDGAVNDGINKKHALKFHDSERNWGGRGSNANAFTGNDATSGAALVYQGIVNKELGADGFPILSDSALFYESNNYSNNANETAGYSVIPDRGSLDYLFNTNNLYLGTDDVTYTEAGTDGNQIKRVYPNVKGLLQLGSDGYYYYNSKTNYAEFPVDADGASTNNDRFNVYDTGKVGAGSFFPFDLYNEVDGKNTDSSALNHFFGLHLKTYFVQNYNGYADDSKTQATTFEFSGDDDVWIFIDGVLAADLGGIHSAASVTINFATGTVEINSVFDNYSNNGSHGSKQTTSFSDIFKDTKVEADLTEYSDDNGNKYTTFVNNSSHTLDFFYLERGGNSSNLSLKYNLLEIPATSIYKVDQYGTTLAGAQFAVYVATKQADGTYLYKDSNGTDVSLTSKTWNYRGANEEGKDEWDILITNSDGTTTIIPCKYCGATDGNGEMIFQNPQGSLYSLDDLAGTVIGSQYFILREVHVPDGYRTVSDESWFHIDDEAGVMLCDSTYTSGVWASNNANVTAQPTLWAAEKYNTVAKTIGFTGPTAEGGHYSFSNYMDSTGETVKVTGTLFAVVLKRNDKTLDQLEEWYPVYGSDIKGYQVVEYGAGTSYDSQIKAVIAAAQAQEKLTGLGSATFTPSTLGSGITAQVVLENLPGKIDRYYTYMQQKNSEELLHEASGTEGEDDYVPASTGVTDTDPQYFVAYYYTSASSVDAATANNTVRVYSRKNVITDDGYQAFDIAWGTTIEVPNMENRLFFQKTSGETVTTTDADGNETSSLELLDGAVFALYEAYEAPNADQTANIVYYVGEDADGKTVYVGLYTPGVPGYEPNKAIVFSDPANETDGKSTSLGTGSYAIDKNFTVDITKDATTGLTSATIAPNEGSEPGKITVTIKNSDGTTTEYYVHPATNAASTPEPLVGATHDTCSIVNENGTGHFTKLKSGKYYLREIKAPDGYAENTTDIPVLVDDNGVYANAGDADNKVAVGNGLGYLSKTLDVFASQNEIDESLTWVYGALIQNNASGFTAFQNVDGDVLTVGDGSSGWMFVTQDSTAPSGYGTGTSTSRAGAMVTYLEYNGSLTQTTGTQPIFDYTPNADQKARNGITADGEGTYRLWTQEGWSDLAVYQDYAYGHSQNPNTTYYTDLTASGNISNLFSSSTFVQVTDEKLVNTASVDVTLNKVQENEAGTTTPLAGAQFRLYKKDADGKLQYYAYNATTGTTWVTEADKATTLTTGENGALSEAFHIIPDAAADSTINYYLEETAAPSGFKKLADPIEIQVDVTAVNGQIAVTIGSVGKWNGTTATTETTENGNTHRAYTYTLTVPNAVNDVTNNAKVDLDLTKVAQADSKTPLQGASFQLYRLGADGNPQYYAYNAETGTTTWGGQSVATTLTSDANGKVQTFFDLEDIHTAEGDNGPTTYYLVETAAPAGYNLLTEQIKIELDITDGTMATPTVSVKISVGDKLIYASDNGNVTNGADGYSVTAAAPVTGEAVNNVITMTYLYTLTVPNSTGYELPHTGGPGTLALTLMGLALTALGGCGLVLKRKRGGAL